MPPPKVEGRQTEESIRKYLSKLEALITSDCNEQASQLLTALVTNVKGFTPELSYIIPAERNIPLDTLLTTDPEMNYTKKMVKLLAVENDAVLICGESGTGKDLLARGLHGSRCGAFVPFNCAAMPQELIESELFGHVQGAFTGAHTTKEGLFHTAKHGTLFLDEIGDLSLASQAKLLRVMQDKHIRKVGGTDSVRINVRIVCATHHDLNTLVKEGKFRLDLLSRINTFPLKTVPLRDRREDIKLIVTQLSPLKREAILKILESDDNKAYTYPSNVRDVERFCRQYEVLGKIMI